MAEAFLELIIVPLGLSKTYLVATAEDFIPAIYFKKQRIARPNAIRTFGASGGVVSTARELMKFSKAFFKGTLFGPETFQMLADYRKLQTSMTPLHYGGGHMQVPFGMAFTLFMGKGALVGHTGSTGSFAFYYPERDRFFVGDLNQMADPSLPVRLAMQLAMDSKN